MKITNIHPAYKTQQERAQRLAELKALCREKLSKSAKSDAKAD